MKKSLYLLLLVLLTFSIDSIAQHVPVGYCGVEFTYDAAGNRIKRQYVCRLAKMTQEKSLRATTSDSDWSGIFPNPTTGKFTLMSSEHLDHANVHILNVNGQLMHQMTISGHKIEINISDLPNGVYFLQLLYQQKKLNYKIVKVSS